MLAGKALLLIQKYEEMFDGRQALLRLAEAFLLTTETDVHQVRARIAAIKLDGARDPTVKLAEISSLGDTVERLMGPYQDAFRTADLRAAIDGLEFYVGLLDRLSDQTYTSEKMTREIATWWERHHRYAVKPSPHAAVATSVEEADAEYERAAKLVYSRGEAAFNKRRDGYALAATYASTKAVCYSCGKPGHKMSDCHTKEPPACVLCADGSKHENPVCPVVVQLLAVRKGTGDAGAMVGAGRGKGRVGFQDAKAMAAVGARPADVDEGVATMTYSAATATAARPVPTAAKIKPVLRDREVEIAC